MAHDKRHISRIASCTYAPGLASSMWYCATTDAAATVLGTGYFNASVDQLAVSDMILVNCGIGGTREILMLQVDSNNGTAVTVSAETGASGA